MKQLLDLFAKINKFIPEENKDEYTKLYVDYLINNKGHRYVTAEEMRKIHADDWPDWYVDVVVNNEIEVTGDLLCSTVHSRYDSVQRGIIPNEKVIQGVKNYFELLGYTVERHKDNVLFISWEKVDIVLG